ncbi:MAG: carboxypeptidase-like regulatory domain-containing protein [Planctomycetaceae bacterium]
MTRAGRKTVRVATFLFLAGGAIVSVTHFAATADAEETATGSVANDAASDAEGSPPLATIANLPAVSEPPSGPPAIDLVRTIILRGTVVDSHDRRIAGARLYLSIDGWNDPVEVGASDADGSYRLAVPERSFHRFIDGSPKSKINAWLIAVAEGYGPAWSNLAGVEHDGWEVMKPEYDQDFRLAADSPIAGRILDIDGKPVAGAAVSVVDIHEIADPRWFKLPAAIEAGNTQLMTRKEANVSDWSSPLHRSSWRMLPSAEADSDGRFLLAGVGTDRAIELRVEGPGLHFTYAGVLTRNDVDGFTGAMRAMYPRTAKDDGLRLFGPSPTIDVERAPTIAGIVRDGKTGEPISGVRIVVKNGRDGHPSSTHTDSAGRYRVLREVSRDPVDVSALPWDDLGTYLPVVRRFDGSIEPNEIVADIDLPHGIVVTGRVLEAGTDRPIISASRYTCDAPWPGALRTGNVKYYPLANNTALDHMPTGLYFADAPARRSNHWLTEPIDADGRFRIAVPPGPGVLFVQSLPGRPEMVMFGGVWKESEGFHLLSPYLTLSARAQGDGAPAGADEKSFAGINGPIPIVRYHTYHVISPPADAKGMDLILTVPRAPSRMLRFVGPDGDPIRGVRVRGLAASSGMTIALDDSDAEVVGLEQGQPREVTAISSDGRLVARTFVGVDGPQPTTIRLEPAGTVSGRLMDATTGQPLANFTIPISYPDPASAGEKRPRYLTWPMTEVVKTDADGRFVIGGLFPGLAAAISFREPSRPGVIPPEQVYKPGSLQELVLRPEEVREFGDLGLELLVEEK